MEFTSEQKRFINEFVIEINNGISGILKERVLLNCAGKRI